MLPGEAADTDGIVVAALRGFVTRVRSAEVNYVPSRPDGLYCIGCRYDERGYDKQVLLNPIRG